MDLTPSQVAAASFRTVRKGYDPDEVDAFLQQASKALEQAQQQATSMEARARAAVARLQEVASAADKDKTGGAVEGQDVVHVSTDEAETISRTLVLVQRTADATIADANAEAERILSEARSESQTTLDSTREMSAKLMEDARAEAREASEAERQAIDNEVPSLVA